jgi:hypothetical protein
LSDVLDFYWDSIMGDKETGKTKIGAMEQEKTRFRL